MNNLPDQPCVSSQCHHDAKNHVYPALARADRSPLENVGAHPANRVLTSEAPVGGGASRASTSGPDAPCTRMVQPSSPVSVSSPACLQLVCTPKDVSRVGRVLVHRARCKRASCEVCSSVDGLLRQVRDHKRGQCSGRGCNFCRKWSIIVSHSRRYLALPPHAESRKTAARAAKGMGGR